MEMLIQSLSMYSRFMCEEDREYLQCAIEAVDDQLEWNVASSSDA